MVVRLGSKLPLVLAVSASASAAAGAFPHPRRSSWARCHEAEGVIGRAGGRQVRGLAVNLHAPGKARIRPQQRDPISWEQIKASVKNSQPDIFGRPTVSAILGRRPQDNDRYDEFRKELRDEWQSTTDYLRCRIFGWVAERNPEGRQECQVPEEPERIIVFRPNDFPYYFESGITHDVIWVSAEPPLREWEVQELMRARCAGRECIWWANPPRLKSVPEIDHVHVVSRARR